MIDCLNVGDAAPDFDFETPWKDPSTLYHVLNDGPVILIFLRYLGCPVCQMEMAKIRNDMKIASKRKMTVLVVLQSSIDTISDSCKEDDWPFRIDCDPRARIFKRYCVEAGGIVTYLHPLGLLAATRAIFLGKRHGTFEGKETQLPAAFVISSERIITFSYYGKRIDDVPSLEELASKG
ncbi:MAG: redoxin domain-containing protein [Syntrophales bacterium]